MALRDRTCREEILDVFRTLEARTACEAFSPAEVVREMKVQGTSYSESTIKTHVVSRMCSNAPDNHRTTYQDLERVGPGQYRRTRS